MSALITKSAQRRRRRICLSIALSKERDDDDDDDRGRTRMAEVMAIIWRSALSRLETQLKPANAPQSRQTIWKRVVRKSHGRDPAGKGW